MTKRFRTALFLTFTFTALAVSLWTTAKTPPPKAQTGIHWVSIGPVQDTEVAFAAQLMEDRGQLPIRQVSSPREAHVSFTETFQFLGRRRPDCAPGNSTPSLSRSINQQLELSRR